MMKRLSLRLALAALALAGCSSVDITRDYDKSFDFKALKTYDWAAPSGNAAAAGPEAALFHSGIVEKHIHNAVNAELAAKGMSRTSSDPDFYVASHLGTEQKINVTSHGYGYGYRWGGYGGVDVRQYTQGTLVLDLIDAKSKELVWRGVATKALASNPDPEKAEQRIREIIQEMLADYPPSKAN